MPKEFQVINSELAKSAISFEVNSNTCENHKIFEDFLKYSALNEYLDGETVTHLFVDTERDNKIIGFFTLRATSYLIDYGYGDAEVTGYPAVEIQWFAVDKNYEGHGYGRAMMGQAIVSILEMSKKKVGIKYILLLSNSYSKGFYKKFDFTDFSRFAKMPTKPWNEECIPMICKLNNSY